MEKLDRLWSDGYEFIFDDTLFQPSTDSFLLGAFPHLKRNMNVCDLGAGSGLLSLLLLAREPSLHVTNVEIQERACALAQRNAEKNQLTERITVLQADLTQPKELPTASTFDLIIANPPYFSTDSGAVSADSARRTARSECACTLDDLCAAAMRLLRSGGQFCLVFRIERMVELLLALRTHRLEPKRLRFVQNKADSAPSLLLLEARKDGHEGLRIEPPLILRTVDGQETDELKRIYFKDKE